MWKIYKELNLHQKGNSITHFRPQIILKFDVSSN